MVRVRVKVWVRVRVRVRVRVTVRADPTANQARCWRQITRLLRRIGAALRRVRRLLDQIPEVRVRVRVWVSYP